MLHEVTKRKKERDEELLRTIESSSNDKLIIGPKEIVRAFLDEVHRFKLVICCDDLDYDVGQEFPIPFAEWIASVQQSFHLTLTKNSPYLRL